MALFGPRNIVRGSFRVQYIMPGEDTADAYPLRFLFATHPAVLTQVLGIVYRAISTFLIRRAGLRVGAGARTGAVILIQRFGSALNLEKQSQYPRYASH